MRTLARSAGPWLPDAVKKLRTHGDGLQHRQRDDHGGPEFAGRLSGRRPRTILDTGDTATTSVVIFGAWSQLLVGYWSGVDILVNPYETTAYMRGRVLMRVMRDCDVAVRHGESFAYASLAA